MVLCLGIGAFTAVARGSIPGLATEIPYQAAACSGQKTKTHQLNKINLIEKKAEGLQGFWQTENLKKEQILS